MTTYLSDLALYEHPYWPEAREALKKSKWNHEVLHLPAHTEARIVVVCDDFIRSIGGTWSGRYLEYSFERNAREAILEGIVKVNRSRIVISNAKRLEPFAYSVKSTIEDIHKVDICGMCHLCRLHKEASAIISKMDAP